ncbi:MAG: transcriptional regulator [Nitrosomonas sp. PRO4]|nr:transcriptional regulator [Nitrosomonas sp. PRO4]
MTQSKNLSDQKVFKQPPTSLINFDSLPDAAFVRVGTVAGLFDCSVVTVWRKAKDGTIPKPKKLSARVTGWRVGDLRATLTAQNVCHK